MASSAMALTVIILAVVILSLTFAPNWSMTFVILLGMIKRKFKRSQTLPKSMPPIRSLASQTSLLQRPQDLPLEKLPQNPLSPPSLPCAPPIPHPLQGPKPPEIRPGDLPPEKPPQNPLPPPSLPCAPPIPHPLQGPKPPEIRPGDLPPEKPPQNPLPPPSLPCAPPIPHPLQGPKPPEIRPGDLPPEKPPQNPLVPPPLPCPPPPPILGYPPSSPQFSLDNHLDHPPHPSNCPPASADDASLPAGNAPAPSLAVDAAGENRRKPESSSTSLSSSGIKDKVFLNFRGTDTPTTITDHLYRALVDVGILVFKGVEELQVGEEIQPQVKEAINQSRILIAILSIDYASSKRCLNELVQMWECRKLNRQTIIPIFYKISPSDVRRMAGDFLEAFNLHKEANVDSSTLKKWREVLRETADLSGYSGNLYEGYEGQLVKEVVLHVARMLRDDGLVVTDKLVGIDLYVKEMMGKLGVAHGEGQATKVSGKDVRIVGICGVPGVGKTTLAKVVFNKMRHLFDVCSFLPGISSKGVQFSQRMLIADLHMKKHAPLKSSGDRIKEIASLCCNAKVLIVLDDVDEVEQIKALAGELTWFGPNSRIIVTTNKRRVLSAFNVGADDLGIVEVEPRSDDHALQLFRNHYFQGDAPEDVSEYGSLS